MDAAEYDPFVSGRFPVGVRTIEAPDHVRGRLFSCEIWYPAHQREALAHLDATLRQLVAAKRFLTGDVEVELAARGVEAIAHRPPRPSLDI